MSIKKFKAELLENNDMDAGYIKIPFNVEKEYGKKRVKVKSRLNGIEYRGSIVRMGFPYHILGIPKVIRNEMGVTFGDIIAVELEEDSEERKVLLPEDLKQGLSIEGVSNFQSLSYSQQKKYVQIIENAKQEKTRKKRIAEIIRAVEKK